MADGQLAGLCHFAKEPSTLGVRQDGAVRRLEFTHNHQPTPGPTIASSRIWLRSTWGLDGLSRYSYSVDGKAFVSFGDPYPLTWSYYRGDRIGLYCYNDKADTGYIDVDWFHYDYSHPPGN